MEKLSALIRHVPNSWAPVFCGSATMAALGLRDVNDLDVLVPWPVLHKLLAGDVPSGLRPLAPSERAENPYPDGDESDRPNRREIVRLMSPDGGIDVFASLPRVGLLLDGASTPTIYRNPDPENSTEAYRLRAFLAPPIVMAIKCLVPSAHPKFAQHMADVAMLAAAHARGEWI